MFRTFIFFLYVASCVGQAVLPRRLPWDTLEFSTLNGRIADPCHLTRDCTYFQYPNPTVTVAIPSKISTDNEISLPALEFTGHKLVDVTQLGLTTPGGLCGRTFYGVLPIDGVVITKSETAITIPAGSIPAAWNTRDMEFELEPRSICYGLAGEAANQFKPTGFKLKVIRAARVGIGALSDKACAAGTIQTGDNLFPVTTNYLLQRAQETSRCQVGPAYQQCYNPAISSCCGPAGTATVISNTNQKCCSTKYPIAQLNDGVCPCFARGGGADFCPADEPLCCLPTKYPELSNVDMFPNQQGECYNANVHQCCDTGHRFDSGSNQCCVINGVQSLDVPCPCSSDSHCLGNYADPTDDADFSCCLQTNPIPVETATAKCDKYNNFPYGTGLANKQPCLGNCISRKYQVCCNGAACLSNIENCCNATCCNKYVGTCARGLKPGAIGSTFNGNNFGVLFEQCSTIEQMNTIKAFWIFVLPTELMFVSFFCLAICITFAAKAQDTHEYSMIEKIMIFVAILTVLFCVPTYFAPIYKYGVVIFIAALLAIVTAAARVKWLNIFCVAVHVIAIIYLFDFVHGNFYLELAEWRNFETGNVDPQSSGILHNIKKLWPSPSGVKDSYDPTVVGTRFQATAQAPDYSIQTRKSWCTQYYNYFRFDMALRDFERFDNPEVTTFGYCSRAWSLALYLFMAGLMDFVILQFIMSVIALVFRFQHPTYEAIATDVGQKEL